MRTVLFGTAIVMIAAVWMTAWAAADIIEIATIEQLQKIGNDDAYPRDGNYIITQDIDASATRNWNDGAGFVPLERFTGSFDGQGYAIRGLYINAPKGDYVGLFWQIGGFGDLATPIMNLNLEDITVIGEDMAGGLAATAENAEISNCHVSGSVKASDKRLLSLGCFRDRYRGSCVGGLVGSCRNSTVSGCSSSAHVYGGESVGGLIGWSIDTRVSRSFAVGPVGGNEEVGGLIGAEFSGIVAAVSDCYANGNVDGNRYVGGLIGSFTITLANETSGPVARCYSTGRVTGKRDVGGLFGYGLTDQPAEQRNDDSFWDMTSSGISESDGGVGKTTAQMLEKAIFTEKDWDFETVWEIEEGVSYPFLRWSSHKPIPGKASVMAPTPKKQSGIVDTILDMLGNTLIVLP